MEEIEDNEDDERIKFNPEKFDVYTLGLVLLMAATKIKSNVRRRL